MLTNDVARAVNRAGLHPGFAVLHATKDEDCACATDLVEQFRGPIAESCAVTLVAQNAIEAGAILQDAKLGYRLADEAREAVIRGYERLVGGSIRDPVAGGYTRWRNLLDRQARRFAEALVGSGAYRAYRMDY
jgi:CRISPR-associated protein Cas1